MKHWNPDDSRSDVTLSAIVPDSTDSWVKEKESSQNKKLRTKLKKFASIVYREIIFFLVSVVVKSLIASFSIDVLNIFNKSMTKMILLSKFRTNR